MSAADCLTRNASESRAGSLEEDEVVVVEPSGIEEAETRRVELEVDELILLPVNSASPEGGR